MVSEKHQHFKARNRPGRRKVCPGSRFNRRQEVVEGTSLMATPLPTV